MITNSLGGCHSHLATHLFTIKYGDLVMVTSLAPSFGRWRCRLETRTRTYSFQCTEGNDPDDFSISLRCGRVQPVLAGPKLYDEPTKLHDIVILVSHVDYYPVQKVLSILDRQGQTFAKEQDVTLGHPSTLEPEMCGVMPKTFPLVNGISLCSADF